MNDLSVYRVGCTWKGRTAQFDVIASDFDAACEVARDQVRKAVDMPKSSIDRVSHIRFISPEESTPQCIFCGDLAASVQAAIDADWFPSFWDGDDEISNPVCAACVAGHLEMSGPNGEPSVKPGHAGFMQGREDRS